MGWNCHTLAVRTAIKTILPDERCSCWIGLLSENGFEGAPDDVEFLRRSVLGLLIASIFFMSKLTPEISGARSASAGLSC
jgi:hypothetical protein